MMVLIAYDVNTETSTGEKRLRTIANICENYGQRVQNSVFECLVDPAQWVVLQKRLLDTADLDKDSLRFYFLGSNWKRKVEHFGAKKSYDPEGLILL
jgi:CRISPR-associated protein Cas2